MDYKVKVNSVSKIYDLNRSKLSKIISLFTLGHFNKEKAFYALRDIDFEVQAGDSVGIIGLNGSGKSTLSDLLGEVTVPSEGSIDIRGKSSLIAISAGLNQDLTGEENIRMKCLMHGMTNAEIKAKYNDIVDFSELGEYIYQPIKSYSSGMRSRLGFAIAIHTNPDVLIVDEALSVGDQTFADKCLDRMKEFQQQGKTIFFVSHSAGQIEKMCNKAVWIQYGEMKEFGDALPIVERYNEFINQYKLLTKEEQLQYKEKMMEKQKEKSRRAKPKKDKAPLSSLIPAFILFLFALFGIFLQIINL
ncbi:ABC transporter ATP-binding protein [Salinicoccus halodurans]|uniref:Teichoic acid ABC transporter ATP-binding protein n=1 Tax=Salinicoccus halodurans TaxID=407035 RepID=A0A0F7HJX8_9STAP|nr:ATP-binding cassette domain-containing protein [Salinicoccus halodurans]AKG73411.1 teichoic acid ABC transporter ATP-binding protein [Salinicoccus halodurans]SFK81123.1 teichoic acid transport system ATP-binding protein [Salinicoccus halodurans]